MKGKMVKRIGIICVLACCLWLQVDLAGGDIGIYAQDINKCKVPLEIDLSFSSIPILNEATVFSIEIRALKDAPNTLIDINLPKEGFRVITGNTNLNKDLSSG